MISPKLVYGYKRQETIFDDLYYFATFTVALVNGDKTPRALIREVLNKKKVTGVSVIPDNICEEFKALVTKLLNTVMDADKVIEALDETHDSRVLCGDYCLPANLYLACGMITGNHKDEVSIVIAEYLETFMHVSNRIIHENPPILSIIRKCKLCDRYFAFNREAMSPKSFYCGPECSSKCDAESDGYRYGCGGRKAANVDHASGKKLAEVAAYDSTII